MIPWSELKKEMVWMKEADIIWGKIGWPCGFGAAFK